MNCRDSRAGCRAKIGELTSKLNDLIARRACLPVSYVDKAYFDFQRAIARVAAWTVAHFEEDFSHRFLAIVFFLWGESA
jgi:hypothetical protein